MKKSAVNDVEGENIERIKGISLCIIEGHKAFSKEVLFEADFIICFNSYIKKKSKLSSRGTKK